MADERRMIKIGSSLPQGVALHYDVPGIDTGGGVRHMVPAGPSVDIAGTETPGAIIEGGVAVTYVDAEFFRLWREQHQDGPLGLSIAEIKPEAK